MANMLGDDKLPDEQYSLCIGMYGKDEDFYSLKGVVTELLRIMGIRNIGFVAESEYGVYHPGRCARITVTPKPEAEFHDGEQEELGIMGEIHPDVAENYGMDGLRIYCCELMFDEV